ncbi:MAG: potassium channel protein [Thermodesulfobacteriota bacterium]
MADSHEKGWSIGAGKIIRGLFILLLVLTVGTAGYMLIEKWHFLDALYMTVITISTVGYREVGELSNGGRIFTLFIIFSGMGIIAYLLSMFAQAMVDLQVTSILGRRKLDRTIHTMRGHYIICGYGRLGRIICRELKANGIPMVVIEQKVEAVQGLEAEGIPYIRNDATSEEVLVEAGIHRARGLISVVASDADNLFITMSARGLNPQLYILVRADEEHSEKKLVRAGANRVVMPYFIGGHKMAQTIVKPAVTDFLDFTVHSKEMGLEMGELKVSEESPLKGLTLIDSGIRRDLDVIIVAIRKGSGEMKFNPSSQTRIEEGDILISLGKSADLARLAEILCSGKG